MFSLLVNLATKRFCSPGFAEHEQQTSHVSHRARCVGGMMTLVEHIKWRERVEAAAMKLEPITPSNIVTGDKEALMCEVCCDVYRCDVPPTHRCLCMG